jgi:type I restriction enzyme M protein
MKAQNNSSSHTRVIDNNLDSSTLANWLWAASSKLSKLVEPWERLRITSALILYKRISDLYEDELSELEITAKDRPISNLYIPDQLRWENIRRSIPPQRLREYLAQIFREIGHLHPELERVLHLLNYEQLLAQRSDINDVNLRELIEELNRYHIGLNVRSDDLGIAYEEFLQKSFEQAGGYLGSLVMPLEINRLLSELLNITPHSTIYDPSCGSASLLVTAYRQLERNYPSGADSAKLYAQERSSPFYAIAKINLLLHGNSNANVSLGDALLEPSFTINDQDRSLCFDYVITSPPWNMYSTEYENRFSYDRWNRFKYGVPPKSSADWAWVQHVIATMSNTGRAAIILDLGVVTRGSGSRRFYRERDIRKAIIEDDLIESVILLPKNIIPGVGVPAVILQLNKDKPTERKGQILLVNASAHFVKEKRKNVLTEEGIAAITGVCKQWETRGDFSRVVTLEEARSNDYNLNPDVFISVELPLPAGKFSCPQCKHILKGTARFCENCGLSLTKFNESTLDISPEELPTILPPPDPLIGHVLDSKYELIERLGEGGVGVVYKALRIHIGGEVAIKLLHKRLVEDEAAVGRFRREAQAAARLTHPNIVTIFDFGEGQGEDEYTYIVMELVKGVALRDLLRQEGSLHQERALSLMREICRGVASFHRDNMVHRDIKPDNIIVVPPSDDDEVERVKVVDFGLAKLRDLAAGGLTLTQTGAILGTPYYMSPEQCRGESLDVRTDVYSLGATLYEMLVGRPPFEANNNADLITKHLTEPPPRLPAQLGIQPRIEAAIVRALAKDPDQRQNDAAMFSRELFT